MQATEWDAPEGRKLTLATAMVQVQRYFPGSWYAPAWWGTPDGCMTYRALWGYVQMLPAVLAMDRLSAARAVLIGQGGEQAAAMAQRDEEEAYPQ